MITSVSWLIETRKGPWWSGPAVPWEDVRINNVTDWTSLVTVVHVPVHRIRGLSLFPARDMLSWVVGSGNEKHHPLNSVRLKHEGPSGEKTRTIPFKDIPAIARMLETTRYSTIMEIMEGTSVMALLGPREHKVVSEYDYRRIVGGLNGSLGVLTRVQTGTKRDIVVFMALGTPEKQTTAYCWVLGTLHGTSCFQEASMVLRFCDIREAKRVARLIDVITSAGYLVAQTASQVQPRGKFAFQIGSLVDESIPRFRAGWIAGRIPTHDDRVIVFKGGDVPGAWWMNGKQAVPVRGPVASDNRWVLDEHGMPLQVEFNEWLEHYYPRACGGLPPGASREEALLAFIQGAFPARNRASISRATWKDLHGGS